MTWKRILIGAILAAAVAPAARAQLFGVGGSVGLVNDISREFDVDQFNHSEVTGWVDYRFEKSSLLRFTYGSMRTHQARSGATVTTPEGDPLTLPEFKERVHYWTLGVSYIFSERWFSSGLFAGLGGYQFRPDAVSSDLAPYADRRETVFGWHVGSEAFFRVFQSVSLVGRATYHNVSAHPHRQWVNLDAGLVVRF